MLKHMIPSIMDDYFHLFVVLGKLFFLKRYPSLNRHFSITPLLKPSVAKASEI